MEFDRKTFALWPILVRIRIRRRLKQRGPAELDHETALGVLAGAAVEAFGEYRSDIEVFEFLLSDEAKNAGLLTTRSLSEWQVRGIETTAAEFVQLMEVHCLLHRRSEGHWQSEVAELFRGSISLWVRDKSNVPTGSALETQLSVITVYALWALLRMRRFQQAERIAIASGMLIAESIKGASSYE